LKFKKKDRAKIQLISMRAQIRGQNVNCPRCWNELWRCKAGSAVDAAARRVRM